MLTGLLGAPAAAAAENPTLPTDVRAQIVGYWETGGVGLKAAAEQALLGGDAEIQKFLDEAESIQFDDNSIETARLVMTGGPGLRQAAKDAMLMSPAELEEFLLSGYQAPLDEDREVDIARLVTLGGAGVREKGKAALLGTADDRELFLNEGQYEAREDDNSVETARLAMTGGPNVKAAAKVALRGTPGDIEEFLEVGQFIARNRDLEHASIAQLIDEAAKAGKQAEDATKQSQEASLKAIAASKLAKEAAQKAAAETEAAKTDSKKAAVKAQQAADAARAAAEAAQEAIGAANAASSAARRAALAAAQTASAAAAAGEAANKAYKAAIAAAGDEDKAGDAAAAAKEARAAAAAAETSAIAAEQAGIASANAAIAADSAKGANANARAAADAADEANDYADAAGLHSNTARQAAAEARRHANTADRAADRSAALARRAATAAYGARDAAKSAATHAKKAADYADEAAAQAGNAATYAAVAKKNADAAMAASTAATAAVTKAREIFDLARETESADLQTRTEGAIERARSMKMSSEAGISQSAASQVKALSLNDTATELAEEAGRPDVDIQATAAKGRQLAMQAMQLLGPWHQEAAARALSGTDQDVLDYLRTRWKEANNSDVRQRVVNLSTQSPYASVRTAATAALSGTPEQIQAFHAAGQYKAGLDDMQVDVARLAQTGGPSVSEKAKAALADGTGKVLATFLQIGQYGERLTDENVIAARLAETGGPELSAAAKVALAGPPQLVHEFIITGQYMAQRKDDLATIHLHEVERLLAEGSRIGAKARADAWLAAQAAALAKQAATEAAAASAEAKKSSDQAEQYAADAKKSADAASRSAEAAAASAATARAAADQADADAKAAESSASQAEFSAAYARNSAKQADDAADKARASATAAGKSETEANEAAKEAWKSTRALAEQEMQEEERRAEEARKAQEGERKPFCMDYAMGRIPFVNTTICTDFFNQVKDVVTDPETYKAIVWELSGLADIKACVEKPTALDCTMAVVGITPLGKLKLIAKIDKGIEAIKAGRAVRRTVSCLTGAAHSFPAGTNILMADGTSRPIEQIRTGDRVTATDPTTGETGSRRVTRTIHTPDDRNFTDVTLADGSTLTSTSHHPYWSENAQEWKDASSLKSGDVLRTPQNSRAVIAGTRDWQSLQDAFDLTVDDLHTYYVSTSATSVLVHNTDEVCPAWVGPIFEEISGEWVTTGVIRDANGKRIPNLPDRIVSQDDEVTKALTSYLKEIGYGSPNQTDFFGASHAETKIAFKMAQQDVKDATVVINNNTGVCTGRDSCSELVKAILPKGSKLRVYHPGSRKETEIVGEGPERP
ncbi:polymorphic toxin-type HINT domain-containing protein [Streptomyces sp. NBC_00257]|uniref:polymorphic toxin-type HINT domain-containing protein n=1 Tax=unclassified Streptomyces TaxID=2593676 RepID=UPI002253AB38|nr:MULTISPECIES: polymorphic toxin-type HINT domain-containing protein [unclassified Streptomyces]MCX4870844.1 polymorphic toxin-type HINT domain-containing protein [Streptomyces sp. NBC_00906]MCX4901584.1 polymorphic toxin-type HINT domain-containing protein [Streptomyces sp. NBC_00892]MCX5426827.1 polymorphic toxin-type HINT domain-containing protein [Streptomyces sp. NBC_00062]